MFSALQARGLVEARTQRRAYKFYVDETKRVNRHLEWAIKRGYTKAQVTMYPNDLAQQDMIERIAAEIAEMGYHTETIYEENGNSVKLRISWRRK